MSDDAKLKIVLYTMVVLTVIAIIGAWELFVKPIALFIGPFIADVWYGLMGGLGGGLR